MPVLEKTIMGGAVSIRYNDTNDEFGLKIEKPISTFALVRGLKSLYDTVFFDIPLMARTDMTSRTNARFAEYFGFKLDSIEGDIAIWRKQH